MGLHARASTHAQPGLGRLRCERVGGNTVVHTALAHSPLRLLLPRNHGIAQWAFAATLGGGLVDGDLIALSVEVEAGAAVVLGTQASTKVYRSPKGCRQTLDLRVGEGALLASIPDPMACFAGARVEQRCDVALAASASLVLVDAVTCGRAASGERWALGRYVSALRITRAGRPLLRDAIELDPRHGELVARMGRFDALATIVAVGPLAAAVRASLVAAPPGVERRAHTLIATSAIGDDLAITRLAATSVEALLARLRALLDPLRALLGDDPFARKW